MSLAERFQTAVSLVYPGQCLACATVVDGAFGLCGPCWSDANFIGGTACDTCGIPLPGEADGVVQCDTCLRDPPPWAQGRAAVMYEGVGRRLVLALKHGDRQEIAMPAAGWMAQRWQGTLPEDTLVAPVPLHWTRLFKRRYNQSALLSAALAKRLSLSHCPDLLRRPRRTRSLDGLGKQDRFEHLADTIIANPKRKLAGRPILLVDDVMTSGATLSAATLACLNAGSGPVRIATLARVGKAA